MIRSALVLAASLCVAASAAIPSTAFAQEPGWSVTSVYGFPATEATTGLVHPGWDHTARVTLDVPDDLTDVYYDAPSGSGTAAVVNGRVALDLRRAADQHAETVTFSESQGGPVAFATTIDDGTPASPTSLVRVSRVPKHVKAGRDLLVVGNLSRPAQPYYDNEVEVATLRRSASCFRADKVCGQSYERLGVAQTDRDGVWDFEARITKTARLAISYCLSPTYCQDDPYAPDFQASRSIRVSWAPRLAAPKRTTAGRATKVTVTVQGAPVGLPVRIQERTSREWRTIRRLTVDSAAWIGSARLRLRGSGSHRLRVTSPSWRTDAAGRHLSSPSDSPWEDSLVYAGISRTRTVEVTG